MIQSSGMTNKINDLLMRNGCFRPPAALYLAALLVVTTIAPSVAAQNSQPFVSYPDIHGKSVVFTTADDLWLHQLNDLMPTRRLTKTQCFERFAKFSPDGDSLAYNLECAGQTQVAILDVASGETQVLQSLPALPNGPMRDGPAYRVAGWDRSGAYVLVVRFDRATRSGQVLSVPVNGDGVERLTTAPVGSLDIAPSGRQWLMTPQARDFRHRRAYRGGGAAEVYVFDPSSGERKNLSQWPGTDRDPVWLVSGQYLVSDRTGRLNLHQSQGGELVARTRYDDADVRWASGDGNAQVIFEVDGRLGLYNADTQTVLEINPKFPAPTAQQGAIEAEGPIHDVALSADGRTVAASVRGDIVVGQNEQWRSVTSGAANDVLVHWDGSGESLTYLRRGAAGDQLRSTSLSTGVSEIWAEGDIEHFRRSPDGQSVAYLDPQGRLFIATSERSSPRPIVEVGRVTQMAWASSRNLLVSNDKNKIYQLDIEDNLSNLLRYESPMEGDIAGLSADLETGEPWVMVDSNAKVLPWLTPVRQLIRLGGHPPLVRPELGLGPETFGAFALFGEHVHYLLRDNSSTGRHALWTWNRLTGTQSPLVTDLNAFAFSPVGKHFLVRSGHRWRIGEIAAPSRSQFTPVQMPGKFKLAHHSTEEWQQMVDESWHRYRFAHRVLNSTEQAWEQVRSRYSELMTKAQSHSEAMEVIARMLGESGSSHAWLEPVRQAPSIGFDDGVAHRTEWPTEVKHIRLPDTDRAGYETLQAWIASRDDTMSSRPIRGLVVDLRGSRGGAASNQILAELGELARQHGLSLTNNAVVVVDGQTSSDAELLAAMAQAQGVSIIGTRTWGGGLAVMGTHKLVDGARLFVPLLPADRSEMRMAIEGQGVIPDVELQWGDPNVAEQSLQQLVISLLSLRQED